jgi:hypothetical protein
MTRSYKLYSAPLSLPTAAAKSQVLQDEQGLLQSLGGGRLPPVVQSVSRQRAIMFRGKTFTQKLLKNQITMYNLINLIIQLSDKAWHSVHSKWQVKMS